MEGCWYALDEASEVFRREVWSEASGRDDMKSSGARTPQPADKAMTAPPRGDSHGAADSGDELMKLVYDDLRRLADRYLSAESPGQTLQPTALVHEAYLRITGGSPGIWDNRAHFFGAAARAIRRILIDRARGRRRDRNGGGRRPLPLEFAEGVGLPGPCIDLLALDEALNHLARIDEPKARVVELRFFGGLSVEETAETLGISASTVAREWRFARVWLHRELSGSEPD
jgi:RNA polymerase sigma-70 factor (ECF subfamily)